MATISDRQHDRADSAPLTSGHRMTDLEAVMWHIEQDPFLSSTFGTVTLLDQPPDTDRFVRRLAHMVAAVPRLHQRVVDGPAWLAPPVWQDDPDFELDYHVRRIALPAPGTREELLELTSRFVQDPLDRHRPLWQYLIVEGVEGSRAALVQKMHHAITDGVGGIRLSARFIDLTRDAPEPEGEPDIDLPGAAAAGGATVWDALAHTARRTVDATTGLVGAVAGGVLHPGRALALPSAVAEVASSTARQLVIMDRARSPLWTERTLQRGFTIFDVDLDEAKRAAKTLGGSLNDFFVTAAAGGAGAYHRHAGVDVDELRMAMPVSTRRERTAGGNEFVPTRLLVPAGIVDPVARFAAVHDIIARVRAEPAIAMADLYAGLALLLPTPLMSRAARRQVDTIDFTTSNVRAAPFDLFIAGSRIDGTYALGPLARTAFNLTMMSYCGQLNMGLHIDRGAVADPGLLRRCLLDSFAELVDAGR